MGLDGLSSHSFISGVTHTHASKKDKGREGKGASIGVMERERASGDERRGYRTVIW
jgi:hypothetical protein